MQELVPLLALPLVLAVVLVVDGRLVLVVLLLVVGVVVVVVAANQLLLHRAHHRAAHLGRRWHGKHVCGWSPLPPSHATAPPPTLLFTPLFTPA